jgi:hypothetical protein
MRLPITIPAGEAAVGWIGFCLLEGRDLTLAEAWNIDATAIAIQADGAEMSYRLPVCALPRSAQDKTRKVKARLAFGVSALG